MNLRGAGDDEVLLKRSLRHHRAIVHLAKPTEVAMDKAIRHGYENGLSIHESEPQSTPEALRSDIS